jgi:hypothetical protein
MKPIMMRLAVCATLLAVAAQAGAQRTYDHDILAETFGFDESTKKSVALEDLNQGCPARDCIPSIDDPKFVTAAEADHVADDAVVIATSYNGEQRAYPARILDHHEIVNDTIGGDPIAITWCPLCGSAIGVRRVVAGEITEFGVSGVLYNSDLVLYDRATETLWDQIDAEGIVGPLTGEQLELVPVTMTRWARWKKAHPDTLVLSTDTGFEFDYSMDRFAKYRADNKLWFPVSQENDAIHPKSVVFGFDVDGTPVAYTDALLQQNPAYEHELNGAATSVALHDDGTVTMHRDGKTLVPIRLYWFAWYTFHPETALVR